MNYVDLTLKRLSKKDNEPEACTLNEAIANDDLVVLLGAPGSGKTSLLDKYHKEHEDVSQVLTVKKLIKLNRVPSSNAKVVLLDGLDEYRSTSDDKVFVMTELGDRIRRFAKSSTVVISCREMDWYGELDVAALKDEVKMEAALYAIQPLECAQQQELATILKIKEPDAFIAKFRPLGILGNPQTFFMLSEIYKNQSSEAISSKTDLYSMFVLNARERNSNYLKNSINILTPEEFFKYAGYLAFYHIFTDIDVFDDTLLEQISDSSSGYPLPKLKKSVNTSLFSEGNFIHRTVAEFALANFLKDYKLRGGSKTGITLSRVKNLFVKKGRIPTELRGTYAWLCSLTRNDELIAVDPYYQVIHGDNSTFDLELKKKVILEVKKYSKTVNPYFSRFSEGEQLKNFYTSDLDEFLIEEFNFALKLKNNYIYFIIDIISSTTNLSLLMKTFVKGVIRNPKISNRCKCYLLDIFEDEPAFLVEILNLLIESKIEDEEDYLLDGLLYRLYPQTITPDKIANYLKLYKKEKESVGLCYYLFETDYSDKFNLIDEIHKNSYDTDRDPHLQLPEDVVTFINDYYLETILKYEESLTANEIFNILKHFKNYYGEYDHLEFRSYRYEIENKSLAGEDKLQRLANELFEIYVDDLLSNNPDDISSLGFPYFYNYKTPADPSEVFLNRINSDQEPIVNKQLFWAALRCVPQGKLDLKKVNSVAGAFNFEVELYNFLHPPKQQWEIKNEIKKKERKEEKEIIFKENEKHFAQMTDKEILSSFGDLDFISDLIYLKRITEARGISLEPGTLDRLKNLLKVVIWGNKHITPELLTLNSLAKNSYGAGRKIDKVYYASSCLNDWSEIDFKENELCKYLFINAMMHDRIMGIEKSNIVEQITLKNPEFAALIFKEYLRALYSEHLPEQAISMSNYINIECSLDKLKELHYLSIALENATIQDRLIYKFLEVFNFTISIRDLKLLKPVAKNEKNMQIILSLEAVFENNESLFDVEMAIAIHSLFSLGSRNEAFSNFDGELKIKLLNNMFNQFNSVESIAHHNGCQSPKDLCARFLRDHALGMLNLEELRKLQEIRKGKNDIWSNRISHMTNEKEQKDADGQHMPLNIEKIKSFVISGAITTSEDFFIDVCDKLNKLKTEIEDNRFNDKNSFYNQDGSKKFEEACRDVILYRLKDKYGDYLALTKERYEADNRVDINIKYKANENFEVQIECKRDDNRDLNTGISGQLVGKYFSSGVQYGIYLIFYFGDKGDKSAMLDEVHEDIPKEYEEKIKVLCIDLRK